MFKGLVFQGSRVSGRSVEGYKVTRMSSYVTRGSMIKGQ